MRKVVLFIIFAQFLFANQIGISLNSGKYGSVDTFRLGVSKAFDEPIYSGDIVALNGFHEVGFSYFSSEHNNIKAISYSPVFTLDFVSFDIASFKPYLEGAIGVAYLSDTKIDNKDLSTRFQFEDRVGIGLKNRNLNFYLRFMHYSTAGIKEPNDGLNSTMVGFSYRF